MNVENRAYRIEERDRSGELANTITLNHAGMPLDQAAAELIAGALTTGTEYTAGLRTLEILAVATPAELLAAAVDQWRKTGALSTSAATIAASLQALAADLAVLGDVELPARTMLDVRLHVTSDNVTVDQQERTVDLLASALGLQTAVTATPYGSTYGTPQIAGGIGVSSTRHTPAASASADTMPSTAEPTTTSGPGEDGQAEPETTVWMAAKRRDTAYHQLKRPISSSSQTRCNRSTRTGLRMTETEALTAGAVPCLDCTKAIDAAAGDPS